MTEGCSLKLSSVCLDYGSGLVISSCSLSVSAGEHHVLLGESGSGKTTLLRAIAGFERCARGTISLGDDVVDAEQRWVAPERRGVGVVFQEYALFPNLNVLENVAFSRGDLEQARKLLDAVGLGALAGRGIGQLSGGEQQRVALARALAQEPRVMLLDEPFSNLNVALRRSTRELTSAVLREHSVTAVFVTHDRDEAFALGDRISVMDRGQIAASGTPEELYRDPRTARVAIATGEASLLEIARAEQGTVATALGSFAARGAGPLAVVRPENVVLGEGVPGKVVAREFLGASYRIELAAEGWCVRTIVPADDCPAVGDAVSVSIAGTVAVVTDDRS